MKELVISEYMFNCDTMLWELTDRVVWAGPFRDVPDGWYPGAEVQVIGTMRFTDTGERIKCVGTCVVCTHDGGEGVSVADITLGPVADPDPCRFVYMKSVIVDPCTQFDCTRYVMREVSPEAGNPPDPNTNPPTGWKGPVRSGCCLSQPYSPVSSGKPHSVSTDRGSRRSSGSHAYRGSRRSSGSHAYRGSRRSSGLSTPYEGCGCSMPPTAFDFNFSITNIPSIGDCNLNLRLIQTLDIRKWVLDVGSFDLTCEGLPGGGTVLNANLTFDEKNDCLATLVIVIRGKTTTWTLERHLPDCKFHTKTPGSGLPGNPLIGSVVTEN